MDEEALDLEKGNRSCVETLREPFQPTVESTALEVEYVMNGCINNPVAVRPSARTWRVAVFPTRDVDYLDAMLRLHGQPAFSGTFSLKDRVLDKRNEFLCVTKDGIRAGYFSLYYKFPGLYEPHVVLAPECRGHDAVEAVRQMMVYAFTRMDCICLVATIAPQLRHVIWTAVRAGFQIDLRVPAKTGSVTLLTARRNHHG